jgi:hypothetical protein
MATNSSVALPPELGKVARKTEINRLRFRLTVALAIGDIRQLAAAKRELLRAVEAK